MAGPKTPLLPPEIVALENYLQKGGRLIVLLNPEQEGGLSNFLALWKITLHNDIVVDTNPLNRLMGLGPAAPMLQPYEGAESHPVVQSLQEPAVMFTARSLGIAQGGLPGVEVLPLFESGESAWGETNLKEGSAALDDKDYKGPVILLALAQKPVGDFDKRTPLARLLVGGDSDWLNNRFLPMQGNRDLFMNLIHYLVEEESKMTIRPKSRTATQLFLSWSQLTEIKFFVLDLLPVLLVAAGLGIVLIRRQR